jgi:dTDP-4-amino-4,6-dideoxygalactose transaminase
LQAAVLRVKLRHLDRDNGKRQELALFYDRELSEYQLRQPKVLPEATHVYHLYVARCTDRDGLRDFLRSRRIGALIHYPVPVHLQPAYRGRLRGSDQLPQTERAAREVLSLPIYPELTRAEADRVVTAVRDYLKSERAA